MNYPLISVIVPCYNVEAFLDKCVESVVGQTYQNLEIFLVDDGATDSTTQICDDWAKKDNRINVIHKTNGGLSDARNVAIDVATGEYLVFVDSDDYIPSDHIEFLYQLLIKYDADISVCTSISFYEGNLPQEDLNYVTEGVESSMRGIEMMFYQKVFDNTAWGKLYKRKLFKDIRYPYGLIYEDLATTYKLFAIAQNIAYSTAPKYYYLLRSNSLDGGSMSSKRFESAVKILEQLKEDKDRYDQSVQRAFRCRILSFSFHILLQLSGAEKEKQKIMLQYIKENRKDVLFNTRPRLKARVASVLSYGGIGLINLFKKYGKSRA